MKRSEVQHGQKFQYPSGMWMYLHLNAPKEETLNDTIKRYGLKKIPGVSFSTEWSAGPTLWNGDVTIIEPDVVSLQEQIREMTNQMARGTAAMTTAEVLIQRQAAQINQQQAQISDQARCIANSQVPQLRRQVEMLQTDLKASQRALEIASASVLPEDGKYLLWNPASAKPPTKIMSRKAAYKVAGKLADQEPGQKFYVVLLVEVVESEEKEVVTKVKSRKVSKA